MLLEELTHIWFFFVPLASCEKFSTTMMQIYILMNTHKALAYCTVG